MIFNLSAYDFLLVFHWIYVSVVHRFQDIIICLCIMSVRDLK